VLVSGTKKLFLKWIGRALRQKRIRFPGGNGPVRWSLSYSFFRASENDLQQASYQEAVQGSSAFPPEGEGTTLCEPH